MKIINNETTEVVDETLEESDNQSESIVENLIEAMDIDLTNSEIGNYVERAKNSKFNCKEKEELPAQLIHEEKIISHEISEVVDETLEESGNQCESIVENQIEAMNTDLTNSEIGNEFNNNKEVLQTTKTTNLTLSKRSQEPEMASNQVCNQKKNFESFDNEEVEDTSVSGSLEEWKKCAIVVLDELKSHKFADRVFSVTM